MKPDEARRRLGTVMADLDEIIDDEDTELSDDFLVELSELRDGVQSVDAAIGDTTEPAGEEPA